MCPFRHGPCTAAISTARANKLMLNHLTGIRCFIRTAEISALCLCVQVGRETRKLHLGSVLRTVNLIEPNHPIRWSGKISRDREETVFMR